MLSRYIVWTGENFPKGGKDLGSLLERCITTFKDEERYKDDERYAKVWIRYVSKIDFIVNVIVKIPERGLNLIECTSCKPNTVYVCKNNTLHVLTKLKAEVQRCKQTAKGLFTCTRRDCYPSICRLTLAGGQMTAWVTGNKQNFTGTFRVTIQDNLMFRVDTSAMMYLECL